MHIFYCIFVQFKQFHFTLPLRPSIVMSYVVLLIGLQCVTKGHAEVVNDMHVCAHHGHTTVCSCKGCISHTVLYLCGVGCAHLGQVVDKSEVVCSVAVLHLLDNTCH